MVESWEIESVEFDEGFALGVRGIAMYDYVSRGYSTSFRSA
jgi:hypothetical protein